MNEWIFDPEPWDFSALWRGEKTFVIVANDRDFKRGDILVVRNLERQMRAEVTHVACVFSQEHVGISIKPFAWLTDGNDQ